jgi:putative endonuclease
MPPFRRKRAVIRDGGRRSVATVSDDLRHRLGRAGERLAAEHLERRGFAIVARNHRTRFGELDLVARDARRLVFCEVKTRRLGRAAQLGGWSPFDALRDDQRRRLRRMAAAWIADQPPGPRPAEVRFDAIGVTIDATGKLVALEHLEDAF